MFDFAKWIVGNLISGVNNGAFSKEWAAVQLGNYYVRGRVTDEDIARFEAETSAPETNMSITDESAETEE